MMDGNFSKESIIKSFYLIGFVVLFFLAFNVKAAEVKFDFNSARKNITFSDNGNSLEIFSRAENVADFLKENKIALQSHDQVFPAQNEKIYSGSRIIILRAKKITIKEGGNTTDSYTFQKTVEQAIWENKNIDFSEDDIAKPARNTVLGDGMVISVTHVLIKEEIKNENIAFKTISNEDDKLGWRIKKTTQKGENGINEVKYKVVYYDGKEIFRKILEKNKTKDPISEIITQGTYVKTGKASTGKASWYAFTGQLCAANPWLPMGSYVKVTNQDNGKSVIVKINDRGPFGNGRIIDLDKVAFQEIASLGAGVANIKMEVILN